MKDYFFLFLASLIIIAPHMNYGVSVFLAMVLQGIALWSFVVDWRDNRNLNN